MSWKPGPVMERFLNLGINFKDAYRKNKSSRSKITDLRQKGWCIYTGTGFIPHTVQALESHAVVITFAFSVAVRTTAGKRYTIIVMDTRE